MRCILGVDCGGSKCHAILARDDGEVVGWGESVQKDGPVRHREFGGHGRTHHAFIKAVREATAKVEYDELHLAAVTNFLPLAFLRHPGPTKVQIHPASEMGSALALAGETSGIVALAGTGAIVYGLTRDGRTECMDGLGPLVGDHGGGYEIGLRAIRAAGQSGWHPRHYTSFASEIYAACGGRKNDLRGYSLIDYMVAQRDRSEVAGLARIVNEAANRGDAVARRILQDAAGGLAATVHDAVDSLGIADEEYALIGVGGIVMHCNLYWEHFCKAVREFAPKFRPTRPDLPAVVGVALSAMAHMPGVDLPAAKATLFESARAMLKARASHA